MMHMEPHILEFDPHSGDFGLGFFGCSLSTASYLVNHPELGMVCYLCNVVNDTTTSDVVKIEPVDLYRRRTYVEPLALSLSLDVGTFSSISLDMTAKTITIEFNTASHDAIPYVARRLRVEKMSNARAGDGFKAEFPVSRGAYVVPEETLSMVITWD